ncbi:diguanylate cyclase, partial [Rhizobium sp. 2YAF20]|uniref:diguanylate cyclase domain-containing protein n=1 Tax=Rhizobium sp. 2YAF20 TaxID=3233027 RepID=UPI003F9CABF5
MRKSREGLPTFDKIKAAASVSAVKLFLFDRDFKPVENLLDIKLPVSVKTDKSFWDHFPNLDRPKIELAIRSISENAPPLRVTHNVDGSEFSNLTIYRIADLIAVIESVHNGPDDERATLLHQATHDALTGLPNRRQFGDDLTASLQEIEGTEDILSLMQLDLDDFKPVNDTLGHLAGDKLLQFAAIRIKGCLDDDDRAYRLAGDEFTIISMGHGQPAKGHRLAEALVKAFKRPFTIDGIAVFVGTSIGISVAPHDGASPEQLMKACDVALYAAKKEGRGRASAFDPAMLEILEQRELS